MTPDVAPREFSRLIPANRLPRLGRTHTLEATADERVALARRLGLESLDSLVGKVTLTPFKGGDMVRVEGQFQATLTQICGVTLEKLAANVAEEFQLTYSLVPAEPDEAEILLDPDADDPPEYAEDGHIDIGEVVAEQLALGIDPFPRAPGAEFVPPGDGAEAVLTGPFAALAKLKEKKN